MASADLAREMTAHYVADTDLLGLGRPDHEPKAAETVGAMVDLIAALIERGHAYPVEGDVYFRVRSDPGYGKLSHRDVAAMAIPLTIFVAAVPWLGLYVPGALLIGYFMRRHGTGGWFATLAVSICTPIVFFLIFERWFLVPLAKGPLEAWLGF